MADLTMGKGVSAGKIASNVQKKITRAQEKVRHQITRLLQKISLQERFFICISAHVKVECSVFGCRVLIILLW